MPNIFDFLFRRPCWKPSIDEYPELRALKFFSQKDVDLAIDALYDLPLRGCPRAYVGDNTIIVPAEAVKFFKRARFEFKDTRVLSSSELFPEERSKLRREQGVF